MKVVEIWNAEYYRDGGSYAFMFVAEDGKEYEFISQVILSKDGVTSYRPPVIFWQDCNSGKIVRTFTWDQAKKFIEPLSYKSEIFSELKQLVNERARNA